jgi:hypothetical protein
VENLLLRLLDAVAGVGHRYFSIGAEPPGKERAALGERLLLFYVTRV